MSYIESNLIQGENIIYKANIHWLIFLPGLFLIVLTFILGIIGLGGYGVLSFILGVIFLINAIITKFCTEMAITNKRVIAKVGFIRRNTAELSHSKIESFNVDQSILGRLLGYGTIIVNGTGGGKTPVAGIDSPLDFRKKAMEAIDKSH